ncbi:D-2-hydroxyacid dehydrogenase [Peribacillus alkalitolerans]|uniref:D-2-hydroxyacid dehydrogenase n=1 Tax=Peribacillus alkalitolerans TaxID=1550385 RepID=UPI0013D4B5E9|nr:D-2-hydroxyacid dehydrogenase [Peribacillus alkalitolerans]
MEAYFSFIPPTDLQERLSKEFPAIRFSYRKGIHIEENDLKTSEILVTYGEDVTKEIIYAAKSLKWIMVVSAGLEKMPLALIGEKGILVTNAKGIHKIPMAEYTIGMLLQYEKNLAQFYENAKNATWDRRMKMGELNGKEITILGAGAIGSEIARLSKAFGMKTVGINTSGNEVEYFDHMHKLDELKAVLPTADYIVSILPSTNDTKNLLNNEHFQLMKSSAVFMNIGRGDLFEDHVLLKALEEGQIEHAILDVFHEEPLPVNHPYWKMENVTMTPHTSSVTKNYLPKSFEIFSHNLHTYIKRETDFINLIDVNRGY